jgi:chromosome segregation ATPase
MAATVSIVAAPRPVDPEAEVLAAYDARQKLQVAIATETQKRDTADADFVRNIAREISYGKSVNAEAVFQRNETAKTAAERAQQRIDALANVLAKINKRIEQLKTECSETVNKALSKRIETLEELLEDKNNTGKGIEEEIKVLKAELNKLTPKTTDPVIPKTTDQATPKTTAKKGAN